MQDITALRSKRRELLALKADLDRQIKANTNEILNHPDLGIDVESLSNKGGSSTQNGFNISFSKSIDWDQEYLGSIKDSIPASAWPFKTKEVLGIKDFKSYCMDYPQHAELLQKGAITKISKSPRIVEKEGLHESNG
jgi:hypothetical protein|tara:strand:+ start:1760 stop:2170 length:411 start_codon:yes stop_codon:yes gene_type:complete